ncbi:uncharacterized protein LOC143179543 [Calliopsis andreniformis]|uniref:uncharacterized protein LOC143179543 n=1 Tax=Calliopsis andreniformis TaxID=337506 RepID=UPI003FCC8D5D
MKRGTKCIAQTINLSNPETCIRPKRIQKLVEAEVMQPCPSTGPGGSSYWTPRPVPIKICSRRDMQRTCPPKLCDCPQKTRPRTAGQKLCNALLFLLKSGIAAGLVYWTHSEGLWGTSADVEDLYCRIMDTIRPALSNNNDVEIPRLGEFRYAIIQKYNHAVYAITSCIIDTSAKLQQQLQEFLASRDEKTKQESEAAKTEDHSKEKSNGQNANRTQR